MSPFRPWAASILAIGFRLTIPPSANCWVIMGMDAPAIWSRARFNAPKKAGSKVGGRRSSGTPSAMKFARISSYFSGSARMVSTIWLRASITSGGRLSASMARLNSCTAAGSICSAADSSSLPNSWGFISARACSKAAMAASPAGYCVGAVVGACMPAWGRAMIP